MSYAKYFFLWVLIFFGGLSSLAFASDFPDLEGNIALQGDRVDDTEREELQAAAEKFSQTVIGKNGETIHPIVLLISHNPSGDIDQYTNDFLAENDLGRVGVDLRSDLIVFVIQYSEPRTIKIFAGDMVAEAIEGISGLDRIQNDYMKPYAANNAAQAFLMAFEGTEAALTPLNLWLYVGALIFVVALLWLLFGLYMPYLKQKKVLLGGLRKLRQQVSLAKCSELQAILGEMSTRVKFLALAYLPVDPERSKKYSDDLMGMHEAVTNISEQLKGGTRDQPVGYENTKFGPFAKLVRIARLNTDYEYLQLQIQDVRTWLEQIEEDDKEVQKLIEEAPKEVEEAKAAFTDAQGAYGKLLPSSVLGNDLEAVLAPLQIVADEADKQLEAQTLLAQDTALRLQDLVRAFIKSFTLIHEAEMALNAAPEKLTVIVGGRTELPNIDELLLSATQMLQRAFELMKAGEYEESISQAHDAQSSIPVKLVGDICDALAFRDEQLALISTIEAEGFRQTDDVSLLLTEVNNNLLQTNALLIKGDLNQARHFGVDEMRSDSEAAAQSMRDWKLLHESNIARLEALAEEVDTEDRRRKGPVKEFWKFLNSEFHRDNSDDLAENLPEAHTLLNEVWDDPNDTKDLHTQAEQLNSLDQQKFADAEVIITNMEDKLHQACFLLDEIEARHTACVQARDTYPTILEKAQTTLENTRSLRDSQDEMIDAKVDDMIDDASQLLKYAQSTAERKNFLEAVQYLDRAIEQSIGAWKSAEEQIEKIRKAFLAKTRTKAQAEETLRKAEAALRSSAGHIVTDETLQTFQHAQKAWNQGNASEAEALNLEDAAMHKALTRAISAFKACQNASQQVLKGLRADEVSYDKLFQQAVQAVERAKTSIDSARLSCSDIQSGSAGDGDLRRAQSELPNRPQRDLSRQTLKQITLKANQSEKHAKKSQKSAEDAIAATIRRKKEEEDASIAAALLLRQQATLATHTAMANTAYNAAFTSSSSPFGGIGSSGTSFGGSSSVGSGIGGIGSSGTSF